VSVLASLTRRRALAGTAGFLASIACYALSQTPPTRIAIVASKFTFTPHDVVLKRGVPVVLVLSSTDFPHGFALPDFQLRRDVVPGKAVEVPFTPDKLGRFHMLCDNFCGEGHDQMSGWLVVQA
jgi:cytochrome c oxidase subunit II